MLSFNFDNNGTPAHILAHNLRRLFSFAFPIVHEMEKDKSRFCIPLVIVKCKVSSGNKNASSTEELKTVVKSWIFSQIYCW